MLDQSAVVVPATPNQGSSQELSLQQMARIVHQGLRGKYILATVLGLFTAVVAAGAVWKLAKPTYHSEGLLRIAYTLPQIMGETDQNRPMLMFDTFMQSQRLLITSRRVIDEAVQDPVWARMGVAVPEKADSWFAQNMRVTINPRSEFIVIRVTDKNPATASAAVNSIISAYKRLYDDEDRRLERQRTGVLQDKQGELAGKMQALTDKIHAVGKEYGTTDLDMFYNAAAARLTKLEAALGDLRIAKATVPAEPVAANADATMPDAAPRTGPLMTTQQIAAVDPVMRQHLVEQTRREDELRGLQNRGMGPNNNTVILAQQNLEMAKERVAKYVATFQEFQGATNQVLGDPQRHPLVTAGKSMAQLQADEASLLKLHTEAKGEMVALGTKQLEIRRLQGELNDLRDESAQLAKRIDLLRAEGMLGGRLSVISSGEIPLSADRDRRPLLGAAGGMAGAFVPAAAILGFSLVRRRYQHSDDTEADMAGVVPMLGILPELSTRKPDEEQRSAAAHSLHQLRVSLRSHSTGGKRSTSYLVTSSTAGEGKTSLTVSLGLSFAASGMRTLLIDCDLIGRRLTEHFDVREREGLCEAISQGSVQRLITRTDGNLYILPVGNAGRNHAHSIPTGALRNILAQVRQYFDIVLIDTGPILGSVEAAVLAPEVDHVIVTIARGRERGQVTAALNRLRSLHANIVGCVFNRAHPQDFERSPYSSSSRSWSVGSDPAPRLGVVATDTVDSDKKADAVVSPRLARFGPLVEAVAGGVAGGRN